MAQRTQRKNVRTTTDKIEYWKVLARFICYGVSRPPFTCGEVTDLAELKVEKQKPL